MKEITKWAEMNGGVFSTGELKNILGRYKVPSFYQKIQAFQKKGGLKKFCRGFYVTESFDLEMLSQRIAPDSYISCSTILAKEMLINPIPRQTVYAVKKGKTRIYENPVGTIIHLGLATTAKRLFFGFKPTAKGIQYADKEKAFLDTLFFHQSGFKFAFNVYSDIDIFSLDKKKIEKYLRYYKNPKFILFVKGILYG